MVLAKENNVFKTVATGSGLFKCTKAYYDAHKNDIPNNTAILITDDAAGGDYVTEDELDNALSGKQDKLVTVSLTNRTVNSYGVVELGFIGKQVVSCRSVGSNTIGRLMSWNDRWFWEALVNAPTYPDHAAEGTVLPELVVTYIA